jgi:hypothetical protein
VLKSDEFVEKISESDDSELSDTDENSNSDFGDQEDNALLLDGDASDLGGGPSVTDADVVWEDRDNLHCKSVNFFWN